MNPVVHFEMPDDNLMRMARFYETAFGWQTQMPGEDMGNYVRAIRRAQVLRLFGKPPSL